MLASGCSPDEAGSQPDAAVDRGAHPVPSGRHDGGAAPGSLVGEYRVAGAGGIEVDLGWAITLSITSETISLQSQCLTPSWRYQYRGGALSTQAIADPVCERAYAPVEQAALGALDQATSARMTEANALVLDGPGGSLTLFSQ